ncbi:hypothetical protein ACFQ60_19250 [Streptomyces zhihengii]|uniref:hypothetical protein n=1 Tax=Streptomyces zhihengii TaxID=1818004 RepID=UPI0035592293
MTERTAGGLPQRRRKSRVSAPAEAFAAHPTAPEPEPEAEPAVQPGMWLAAFQNGLSGDTSKTNNGNEQP